MRKALPLAALIFLLVLASFRQRRKHEDEQSGGNGPGDEDRGVDPGLWPPFSTALDRLLAQHAAERDEAKRAERCKTKLEVCGLAVLATYTAVTAGIFCLQRSANNISLGNSVAQTRAWLHPDELSVAIIRDMLKNPKVLTFAIHARVLNVGQSPSLGTAVHFELVAGFGPYTAQRSICGQRGDEDVSSGEAVFPDQDFSKKDHPVTIDLTSFETLPKPRVIYLLGCVDYRVVGDQEHHHTQVIRTLVGPDGIAPNTISGLLAHPLTLDSSFAEVAD